MRIAHFIPAYRGQMEDATAESMVQTALWIERNGHTRIRLHAHDPWVHMSRNRALERAISKECDWLFMQDADVSFTDDVPALELLLQTAMAQGASVVAAAVRRRARCERIAASSARANDVYEVDHAGTGMMLIDVKAVADVEPPWFDCELNESGTGVTADEGPTFCRKLRAAGHAVYCDFTFPTLHHERRALGTLDMMKRSTVGHPDWKLTKKPLSPGEQVED